MDSICHVIEPSSGNHGFGTPFFRQKLREAALDMKVLQYES